MSKKQKCPKFPKEYIEWLSKKYGEPLSESKIRTYYESVTSKIKADFETSDFWKYLIENLKEFNSEYELETGYPLFPTPEFRPKLYIKPFDSFLFKTYRKNCLENKNWPDAPKDGWILPNNWYSRINDIIRTLIVVKYLDGVEYMIEKIKSICGQYGLSCRVFLEARDDGYYAAHLYVRQEFEIPRLTWDTEKTEISVEIQITTQLQEVIRKLLHRYYEEKRKKPKKVDDIKWQWNYESDEFIANYLGHILHYVEGMIMEIRKRQKEG